MELLGLPGSPRNLASRANNADVVLVEIGGTAGGTRCRTTEHSTATPYRQVVGRSAPLTEIRRE